MKFFQVNKFTLVILIIFVVLSYFLFSFRLEEVPLGINGDEAVIAYNAALISKDGKDSEGRWYPVFTKVENSSDWKQPIMVYATVLVFKFLGISYFNLKLVSVLMAIISGLLIFFMAKELLGFKYGVVSLIIFLSIPIVMIQSHINIENIAPLPFITVWLWMLIRYAKFKRNRYLIIAGIMLGVSIYSYLGLRLVMPVLMVISMVFIFSLNVKKSFKGRIYPILLFIFGIVPFIAFLFSIKEDYPGAILASNRPQVFESYQQLILPFISSYDLSFLFIKGDSTPYHSTGKEGMFLLATLPLFILGLFKIAKELKPVYLLILAVFFLSPILYGLPGSIHRASRLLVLIPPFVLISVLGFQNIIEFKARVKILLIGLVSTLIILNYSFFLKDYWFEYPNRVNQSFEKPVQKAYKKADEISKAENLRVLIHSDIPQRQPYAYSFFSMAYMPDRLQIWQESTDLPKRSILMVTEQILKRSINVKERPGVEIIDNGNMDIFLVINRND